ncbi:hypothetical protein [Haloferula sp. A504]|uniref:hypothetical protein n=1 Tax=Haloferula sp. A504 TaxID=3373601 RepID=UPI0031C61FF5|nr:hypothetical protein [Verrucomicrobiaceae bacterium E54]
MTIRRLICAGLLLAPLLPAQENLFIQTPNATHPKDKTRIEVESLFSMAPPTGYLPLRVTVVNQRKNDGRLRLRCLSESGVDPQDSAMESEFSIESTAGTAKTTDLLVPLTTRFDSSGYEGLSVQVLMSGSFGGNNGSLSCNFHPDGPAILMSEPLFTPNSSALDAQLNSTRSGGYGSYTFAARFTPSKLPEDWRAYSGYDVIMLTDDDWGGMPPGARAAVLQWIRLGGVASIYRRASTSFGTLGIETQEAGNSTTYGLGTIELLNQSGSTPTGLDAKKTVNRYHTSRGGLTIDALSESISDDYSSGWALQDEFGKQKFDYLIFIIVLIAFGVLVGPVNLFVFAKSGMRHKLFITTPVISIATSVLLIALILMRDGTGGRGARIALIEVRPESGENRAYVVQEQVSRTGVLLGSSFKIDEDSAITPVPIANSAWARLTPGVGGAGMRFTGNFTEGGMEISGDWFQSRSEQGQLIRAVVPTRGRIELKGAGGAPTFVSTYDFPVERLYYADRSNGYWMVRDLEAGKATTGTPISEAEYRSAVGDESRRLARRQREQLNRVSKRADHYVAVATEAPAIETFDAINWVDTRTILTGPVLR